jgi:hypothetical protein
MPRINDPENFHGRVNFAALIISQGRPTSRGFDGCFENHDGDAVATALYRRAQARPESALARNLWRYLGRESVEAVALDNAHRTNLAAWSRELRARAARQFAEFMKAEGYAIELTPAGEQAVIPGCERNASPGVRQLDLFG